MLDERAHRGDAFHVVQRGVDDIFRMREDEALDAAPLRFLEDDPGLADVQMAARQHHVVPGDDVEHLLDVVAHRLVGVEHRMPTAGRILSVEAGWIHSPASCQRK